MRARIFIKRLTVVFLIQLMIKLFDHSFEVLSGITLRGFVVSFYFTSFWLAVWYLAEAVNRKLREENMALRTAVNVCLAFIAGFLTNKGYELIDIFGFGYDRIWEEIGFFNPELTVGTAFIYLLIFASSEVVEKEVRIRKELLRIKELEKQSIQAQYAALKRQIEPHFLFNSLSVLSGLVYTDPDVASDFIVKLSKILRYIIERNASALVPLKDELQVVSDYLFLLKTRFKEAVNFSIRINADSIEHLYLPSTSLQTLLENAVKHNKLGKKMPLSIEMRQQDDFLVVKNNLNKKKSSVHSFGKGLSNLKQRYELITDREMIIEESESEFAVFLPVLTVKDYEYFNN
ncbi:MAG: histidine kinase [Cytophagales bacterium]|nr:histidine kinase [Cytophagales bacterium]